MPGDLGGHERDLLLPHADSGVVETGWTESQVDRTKPNQPTSHLTVFRSSYRGALICNMAAFFIPAIYSTLSKLWVARMDSTLVSTLDAYTYLGFLVGVINEGLPRAAWSTIGSGKTTNDTADQMLDRLSLTFTLISVQASLGFALSAILFFAAPAFVGAYIPGDARDISVKYIRILAFDSLASTVAVSVSFGTRAMDKPDVPIFMLSVQTVVQVILELALVSTFRIPGFTPTIVTTATIKLVCGLLGSATGLVYFILIVRKALVQRSIPASKLQFFSMTSLKKLLRPGRWTITDSVIRNAIFLYQIRGVISMGQTYATAWGVFNAIRWGIVMVPISALHETTNTFVGHRWGDFKRKRSKSHSVAWRDIAIITSPILRSCLIALGIELFLFAGLSINKSSAYKLAHYLSNSTEVAEIASMMWRNVEWCFVCYAVSSQLVALLLATEAEWFLSESLLLNVGYMLPCAVVFRHFANGPEDAWVYHRWIVGGALVAGLFTVIAFDLAWIMKLRRWKLSD